MDERQASTRKPKEELAPAYVRAKIAYNCTSWFRISMPRTLSAMSWKLLLCCRPTGLLHGPPRQTDGMRRDVCVTHL